MLPRRLRWFAVLLVGGVVFYASVLAAPTGGGPAFGPFGVFGLDKWLHALAYAGVSGTVTYAWLADERPPRAAVLAFALTVAYGVCIEFVQAPIPARHFSVADMAADAVGAAVGTRVVVRLFAYAKARSAATR